MTMVETTQADRYAALRLPTLEELRLMLAAMPAPDAAKDAEIVALKIELANTKYDASFCAACWAEEIDKNDALRARLADRLREERSAATAHIVAWLRDRHSGKLVSQIALAEAIERGDHITDPAEVLARNGAKPDPLTTWDCPIKHEGCVKNCGSYGCGN